MDYYDRKLMNSGHSYIACFFSFVAIILLLIASFFVGRCTAPKGVGGDTISVDSIITSDTTDIEKTDTMPKEKKEKETIIKYITIPCNESVNDDTDIQDSLCSSVSMPIVQKEFSDDSTYTAYVSGLKYEQWPMLDSISVRQREITNTIVKTITIEAKKRCWSFGVQVGYGYGVNYKGFEPYIGVGVQYTFK